MLNDSNLISPSTPEWLQNSQFHIVYDCQVCFQLHLYKLPLVLAYQSSTVSMSLSMCQHAEDLDQVDTEFNICKGAGKHRQVVIYQLVGFELDMQ